MVRWKRYLRDQQSFKWQRLLIPDKVHCAIVLWVMQFLQQCQKPGFLPFAQLEKPDSRSGIRFLKAYSESVQDLQMAFAQSNETLAAEVYQGASSILRQRL